MVMSVHCEKQKNKRKHFRKVINIKKIYCIKKQIILKEKNAKKKKKRTLRQVVVCQASA